MNVALPALVIFLILLPGFIFRSCLKRAERTSLDYSPFGQVVAGAVLWAIVAHIVWLTFAALAGKHLQVAVLLKLLSSDGAGQTKAGEQVAHEWSWIAFYFASLLACSFLLPSGIRLIISHFRLDRDAAPMSSLFRFHRAPWYYLLSGADFLPEDQPDVIVISAVVVVGGEAFIYTGYLDEFFVGDDGTLDRLILQNVMRRPINADKTEGKAARASRFYAVDGDYFVLRYAEAVTLNVEYVRFNTELVTTTLDSHIEPRIVSDIS